MRMFGAFSSYRRRCFSAWRGSGGFSAIPMSFPDQKPRRPILWFFCGLFAIFLVLVAPWPGFRHSWEVAFLGVTRPALSLLLPWLELSSFPSGDPAGDPVNARIQVVNPSLMKPDGSGPVRNVDFDAAGFWRCTALLLAMVLATPFPWKRRVRNLAASLAGCYLLALAILWFTVWRESCALYPGFESTWLDRCLATVESALTAQLTLAVPVLAWALTVLPGSKWVKLLREDR